MESPFHDPADSPRASHWPDIAEEIDKPEDILREFLSNSLAVYQGNLPVTLAGLKVLVMELAIEAIRETAGDAGAMAALIGPTEGRLTEREVLKFVVTEIVAGKNKVLERIMSDNNPLLEAECVDFVFALNAGECRNQTQIAAKHGIGKACVSDRCVELRKEFNLPEVPGMKSDDAREKYADRQRGRRQRPERSAWGWSGFLKGALSGITSHAA